MPVRALAAASAVRATVGRLAVSRGPLACCAEEVDNGADLHQITLELDESGGLKDAQVVPAELAGFQVQAIDVAARRDLPSASTTPTSLYQDAQPPSTTPVTARLVPYFAWANRGIGEMSVWLRG